MKPDSFRGHDHAKNRAIQSMNCGSSDAQTGPFDQVGAAIRTARAAFIGGARFEEAAAFEADLLFGRADFDPFIPGLGDPSAGEVVNDFGRGVRRGRFSSLARGEVAAFEGGDGIAERAGIGHERSAGSSTSLLDQEQAGFGLAARLDLMADWG